MRKMVLILHVWQILFRIVRIVTYGMMEGRVPDGDLRVKNRKSTENDTRQNVRKCLPDKAGGAGGL